MSSDLEAKDLAATLRTRNFYITNTEEMVPEIFHYIKEGHRGKDIHKFEHEVQSIRIGDAITQC